MDELEMEAPITPSVKIFIASDHTGFVLKFELIEYLREEPQYEVIDVGALELTPGDDYPDFIAPCAEQVVDATKKFPSEKVVGIVIGGSGQGEAMVANRTHGVRAAVYYGQAHAVSAIDAEGAPSLDGFDIIRLARLHNDANILSLGARFVSENEAKEAVQIFLDTEFLPDERHLRRISKF
jgi:ribose 5-phosphate isomerase B